MSTDDVPKIVGGVYSLLQQHQYKNSSGENDGIAAAMAQVLLVKALEDFTPERVREALLKTK